jgi:hypothetical protein
MVESRRLKLWSYVYKQCVDSLQERTNWKAHGAHENRRIIREQDMRIWAPVIQLITSWESPVNIVTSFSKKKTGYFLTS